MAISNGRKYRMSISGKVNPTLLWILAIAITISAVIYQRTTGPTYAKRGKISIDNKEYSFRLLRSHDNTSDARIAIYVPDTGITGEATYRRYKSHDEWTITPMSREGENLVFYVPKQPAAGKISYNIALISSTAQKFNLTSEPVTIRFKGPVPRYILYPHILCMFTSILIGVRAGLEALFKGSNLRIYSIIAGATLLMGGIILGPIVQKFAFDAYWTGWPFGHDMTDNKTALSMLFWIIAIWKSKDLVKGRKWVIMATVVQLAVYLIPHSVLGSEIDYTKTPKP